MDEIAALHTAARRYCMERHAITYVWNRSLQERTYGDGFFARIQSSVEHAPAVVLGAILVAVEAVEPGAFATADEMRTYLLDTGRRVETYPIVNLTPEIERAMQEQREAFCAYIADLSSADLRAVAPLPYRRTLGTDEILGIWARLQLRWGARPPGSPLLQGSWSWYPLDTDLTPQETLTVQTPWFAQAVQPVQLQRILAAHGVGRVWMLPSSSRPEQYAYEIDLASAPAHPGNEMFCISEALDWLLYATHEDALTIGGAWLVDAIKRIWPGWQRHLYGGPSFERPRRESDDRAFRDAAEPVIRLIGDLTSRDLARKARAREALQRDGASVGEPILAVLIDTERPANLRIAAAQALAVLGTPAVPGLIAALSSGDDFAQVWAAIVLKTAGDERAVEPLIAALRASDSQRVRNTIAETLGRLRDERALAPLLEHWEQNVSVRIENGLCALGMLAVPPLVAALADPTRNQQTRLNAAAHIEHIYRRLPAKPASGGQVPSFPTIAPEDVIGDDHTVETLMRLIIDRADDGVVRARAVHLLPLLAGPEAQATLLARLDDPGEDPQVRGAVLLALPSVMGERAVNLLLAALADAEPHVCDAAIAALGACGDERTLSALSRLWQQRAGTAPAQGAHDATRLGADSIAAASRDRRNLPRVISVLRERHRDVAGRAIRAIERRLGYAPSLEEDPAGEVVAHYGRVRLRAPKKSRTSFSGETYYYICLSDGEREGELGLYAGLDGDRRTVLTLVRRQRASLLDEIARCEEYLREPSDRDHLLRLQHRIKRATRQLGWVEQAIHELETAPDEGQ